MSITDEAVEAAAKALCGGEGGGDPCGTTWESSKGITYLTLARAALEAATPLIRAHALREAAQEFHDRLPDGTGNGRAYNAHKVAQILRGRAEEEYSGEIGMSEAMRQAKEEAWEEGKNAVWAFMSNTDPRRERPTNPYAGANGNH